MRMNQDERRFDFHGLGAALKRAREEKGWTQAYVAELVDRDSRTIMNIENKGQYPSFDLFVKLITMFDVSVDQFIHADGGARSSSCRKHIDVLLNSMNEKELVVIEATAEGIKKARETEVLNCFPSSRQSKKQKLFLPPDAKNWWQFYAANIYCSCFSNGVNTPRFLCNRFVL